MERETDIQRQKETGRQTDRETERERANNLSLNNCYYIGLEDLKTVRSLDKMQKL